MAKRKKVVHRFPRDDSLKKEASVSLNTLKGTRTRNSDGQKAVQECCSGIAGKLDCWDWKLVKLSIVSATLVIVSAFAVVQNWVASVEWYWFFIAMVIFAIRPIKRAYSNYC